MHQESGGSKGNIGNSHLGSHGRTAWVSSSRALHALQDFQADERHVIAGGLLGSAARILQDVQDHRDLVVEGQVAAALERVLQAGHPDVVVGGRGQTPEQIERLAGELGVEYFIVGHRHSEDGFEVLSPRCVSITSDGAAGCVIRAACDRPLTSGSVTQYIKPIVSLG